MYFSLALLWAFLFRQSFFRLLFRGKIFAPSTLAKVGQYFIANRERMRKSLKKIRIHGSLLCTAKWIFRFIWHSLIEHFKK
jgi:hypothetical protein